MGYYAGMGDELVLGVVGGFKDRGVFVWDSGGVDGWGLSGVCNPLNVMAKLCGWAIFKYSFEGNVCFA